MPNKLKIIYVFESKGDKFLKDAKQHFLLPRPLKTAKNMLNYDEWRTCRNIQKPNVCNATFATARKL